jgi:hypothetical protein
MSLKTIPIDLDGFKYNVIQMGGKRAIGVMLKITKLLGKAEGADVVGSGNDMGLMMELLGRIADDSTLPLIEELLKDVRLIPFASDSEKQDVLLKGFNPDRHPMPNTIMLDHFVGKDLAHIPLLVWEILKANFQDFFNQLKERFASRIPAAIADMSSQKQA